MDASDVRKPLERKVTLEVPFTPSRRNTWERATRKTAKLLRGRPTVYEHTFRETTADGILEYLDIVAKAGQKAFQQPPPSEDFFQGFRDSIAGSKQQVHASMELLRHITGIDDEEFLAVLTPSQRDSLIEAFEAVNPCLTEVKKNLDQMFLAAVGQMAAKATEQMLRENPVPGPERQIA